MYDFDGDSSRKDAFLKAVRMGVPRKSTVDLYLFGDLIKANLPISEGSIKVDRNSRSRRSGSITVADETLWPDLDTGVLAPHGIEVIVKSGVVYPSGIEELVPMGVFLVKSVTAQENSGGFCQLELLDRAERVWEYALIVPDSFTEQFFAGRYTSEVVAQYLVDAAPAKDGWSRPPYWPGYPEWTFTWGEGLTDIKIPGGSNAIDTDRWELISKMTEACGGVLYFDRLGNGVAELPTMVTSGLTEADCAWTVDSGDVGVLIGNEKKISRDDTWNGVFVAGQAAKDDVPQPNTYVIDDNPASPTYFYGPFGKKIMRMSNSLLTDESACYRAALSKLQESAGLHRTLSFSSLVNPALDVDDLIYNVPLFSGTGIYIVDTLDVPLVGGEMSATARGVQYI